MGRRKRLHREAVTQETRGKEVKTTVTRLIEAVEVSDCRTREQNYRHAMLMARTLSIAVGDTGRR